MKRRRFLLVGAAMLASTTALSWLLAMREEARVWKRDGRGIWYPDTEGSPDGRLVTGPSGIIGMAVDGREG